MQLAMSIAVMLVALGLIGLGAAMVQWSNHRKGL